MTACKFCKNSGKIQLVYSFVDCNECSIKSDYFWIQWENICKGQLFYIPNKWKDREEAFGKSAINESGNHGCIYVGMNIVEIRSPAKTRQKDMSDFNNLKEAKAWIEQGVRNLNNDL